MYGSKTPNARATNEAIVDAGAWYIYLKHFQHKAYQAIPMIEDCTYSFVKNTNSDARLTEFGRMYAKLNEVRGGTATTLEAHEEGLRVLRSNGLPGGDLEKIYEKAIELGVPEDSPFLLR